MRYEFEIGGEEKRPAAKGDLFDDINLHNLHRQRARERAELLGFMALKPHEVMELILFSAYRRANTNEISHALIDRFGTVGAVLKASEEELMSVEGVGYHAAKVIGAFQNAVEAYRGLAADGPTLIVNRAQAVAYAQSVFANDIRPQTRYLLVDGNGCLSFCTKIAAGAIWLNEKTLRQMMLRALKYKAHYVVILSKKNLNLGGIPTVERLMVSDLYRTLKSVGVQLIDYILVTPQKAISLRQDFAEDAGPEDKSDYGISVRESWLSDPGDVWESGDIPSTEE